MRRTYQAPVLVLLAVVVCVLAACNNTDYVAPNQSRPTPVSGTFRGCPAKGSGGDPQLNTLENRVDDPGEAKFTPYSLDALTNLGAPTNEMGRNRSGWQSADLKQVGQYEGLPVQTTGYVTAIRYVGPEPVNCNSTTAVNYYLWISDNASDAPALGMVTVITPRVQASRPGWTLAMIRSLPGNYIRVSGWFLFDQEPPATLGLPSATHWEVHPIMHIDVDVHSKWVNVDQKPLAG